MIKLEIFQIYQISISIIVNFWIMLYESFYDLTDCKGNIHRSNSPSNVL